MQSEPTKRNKKQNHIGNSLNICDFKVKSYLKTYCERIDEAHENKFTIITWNPSKSKRKKFYIIIVKKEEQKKETDCATISLLILHIERL